jgi:hypothetical protein
LARLPFCSSRRQSAQIDQSRLTSAATFSFVYFVYFAVKIFA